MDIRESEGALNHEFEMDHWWIRTRFCYIDRLLADQSAPFNVLEAGCGTAQNLHYLRQQSRYRDQVNKVVGFDSALSNASANWLTDSDALLTQPPDTTAHFNVLLAMDLLEHIQDPAAALKQWLPLLTPDARVLITVPAFQQLWSYHDEQLGHYRRYTVESLLKLAEEAGLRPVSCHYVFSYLYPAVWLLRRWRQQQENRASSDLQPTAEPLNTLLYSAGWLEAKLGGNRWLGTSVVGVFELNQGIK